MLIFVKGKSRLANLTRSGTLWVSMSNEVESVGPTPEEESTTGGAAGGELDDPEFWFPSGWSDESTDTRTGEEEQEEKDLPFDMSLIPITPLKDQRPLPKGPADYHSPLGYGSGDDDWHDSDS